MFSAFSASDREKDQQAPPQPRLSFLTAHALYVLSAVGLLLLSLFSERLFLLFSRLFPSMPAAWVSFIVSALYYVPFTLFPVMLTIRRADAWETARMRALGFGDMIAVSLTAILGIYVTTRLSVLWQMLLYALGLSPTDQSALLPTDPQGLMVAVLTAGALAGVCEDLLFRGAIMSAWERRGTKRAILVSALLFTLLHGSVGGMPTQFLLGVVLGFLVYAFDSIYAGIVYHTVHNAMIMIAAYVVQYLPDAQTASTAADTMDALMNLQTVVELSIALAVSGAVYYFVLRAFGRRAKRRGIAFLPNTREPLPGKARAPLWLAGIVVVIFYFFDVLQMLGRAL